MYSKYEVYTTVQSIYCYKDSNVLINKLKIKDYEKLKKAEEQITSVKQFELFNNPINGYFTKNHFFKIHQFLFSDIYPFAGKIRKEQISKGDTMFYPPELINEEINKLFKKIKLEKMMKEKNEDKVFDNLAYVMGELNIIHPFREGNGRSIREFIRIMAKKLNYNINWGNVNKNVILNVSIESVYNYKVLKPMLKNLCE